MNEFLTLCRLVGGLLNYLRRFFSTPAYVFIHWWLQASSSLEESSSICCPGLFAPHLEYEDRIYGYKTALFFTWTASDLHFAVSYRKFSSSADVLCQYRLTLRGTSSYLRVLFLHQCLMPRFLRFGCFSKALKIPCSRGCRCWSP